MTDRQAFVRPDASVLHPQDCQHIRLSYITHFYFDQDSGEALTDMLRRYESYAPDVLDRVHFVIVDDASPLSCPPPPAFNLNITWLRISEDITFNMSGAKNLGVLYAKSDKILITDLDYEYPERTLRHMIERANPGKKFYKIRRKGERKGHSNNFFMSRARFMRLYGYDEEFAGGYGAEDYRFVKFLKNHGTWQRNLPGKYWCVSREDIDRRRAWHSLVRDNARNAPIDRRKRSELLQWGAEAGHSRMFLNFRWDVVQQNFRDKTRVRRPTQRRFKWLWWFRTLFGSYD